jgi:hypothetical protein
MENIKNQLKSKIDQFEGPEHGDFAQKFKQYNAGYAQYAAPSRTVPGLRLPSEASTARCGTRKILLAARS